MKQRFQHRLKGNKTTEFPYHFIFFDTETYQVEHSATEIEHVLRLGVALYWRRGDKGVNEMLQYRKFVTPIEFWRFVMSKCTRKRRLVIISHNLPFDMAVVKGWYHVEKEGFKPIKIILNYQSNIWKFRKETVTLLFIDNMNYFRTSLEVLGESLGIKKLTMPTTSNSLALWYKYCKRDVEILLKAWRNWHTFLDDNDLGSFGYTLPSQAFNAFRHRFMPTPVSIHTSVKAIALERRSYRGGRNECFRIGEFTGELFYLVDVNSMYPFVMESNHYPHNLVSTGSAMSIDDCKEYLLSHCIVADCIVKTYEPCYGIKLKDRLVFPTGEFVITLTTKELIHAIQNGHLKHINDYALYEKADLFSQYVNFFYDTRRGFIESGNAAYAEFCKIFLNSLYGKFGQKIENWEFVCEDSTRDYDWWQEYDYQRKCIFTYRCINHRVEMSHGYEEGFNSLVAISSEVTANARLLLWRLICLAGNDNVYYCDTDSLIVNESGYKALDKLYMGDKLGQLKLVDTTDNLRINNLKDYSFGGKVKIKGIRKDAEMISVNQYRQYQNIGIKSGLHFKDINRVVWRSVVKTLSREYAKGDVTADGRVIPYNLSLESSRLASQPTPPLTQI